jgi:hypothetical protein
MGSGPVKQLVEIRNARTKQNAAGAWRRLRLRMAVAVAANGALPKKESPEDDESVGSKFKTLSKSARLVTACAAFNYGVPLHMLGEKQGEEIEKPHGHDGGL